MKNRLWVQKINFYICAGGMSLLLLLMFLTTADVLGRNFFSKTIPGAFELSEYILVVLVLLGAGYTQQIKGYTGVDFFTSRLSPFARLICQIITNLLSLFIIALVIWQGWVEGIQERTVSDILRIPQYPFRLLVAIGGFFLWLEIFFDLQDSLAKFNRGKK